MNNYPEEIYYNDYTIGEIHAAERAYDLGREHAKQKDATETEWHNLTEQIQAGANIDWEKLDGMKARCVHAELGTLTYKLERYSNSPECSFLAWFTLGAPKAWTAALAYAWSGRCDWTLYIDRPVPLKRKTADQLELGAEFIGQSRFKPGEIDYCYVVTSGGKRKVITAEGLLLEPEWVEVVDDEA